MWWLDSSALNVLEEGTVLHSVPTKKNNNNDFKGLRLKKAG